MKHEGILPGTKVRVFTQRITHHERTKSGWKVREEVKPERFGVICECNPPYRVKFPDGSIEEVHPIQLEPYEWD